MKQEVIRNSVICVPQRLPQGPQRQRAHGRKQRGTLPVSSSFPYANINSHVIPIMIEHWLLA